MMDRLDHLLDAASPLLDRVDHVLSTIGAPEGHPVWRELRRVRLLPGDAARAVGALDPEAILDAVSELRADAQAYAAVADSLPPPGEWEGEAADAYDLKRRRTAEHLNGGPGSLGHRMRATADLADALTAWMARSRGDLAAVLAAALISQEAVTLTTGTPTPATPPADALPNAAAGPRSAPPPTAEPGIILSGAAAPSPLPDGTTLNSATFSGTPLPGALSPAEEARLAADLAAPLLQTVADSYDRGEPLIDEAATLQTAATT
ncbi:hypothetical protein [Actinoplanes sp. NPDC023714]|uniref:hypothetical protein n=1 Tax=Actinoplanes sp. NPDC023714 TaxID=3154322 RepID=UPI00340944A0